MKQKSHFKTRLHTKRAATEEKIRRLEKAGKAGERYTARISDVNFLIFGLLCDIGWIIHLIAGIQYFVQYRFHTKGGVMTISNIFALVTLVVVVFGIVMTIYMNLIHEKEIATRLQKNLSFGATIFGGVAAGVIGILQIILAVMTDVEGIPLLIGITVGGFMNFAFGLPIFASFKKGIYYSSESEG